MVWAFRWATKAVRPQSLWPLVSCPGTGSSPGSTGSPGRTFQGIPFGVRDLSGGCHRVWRLLEIRGSLVSLHSVPMELRVVTRTFPWEWRRASINVLPNRVSTNSPITALFVQNRENLNLSSLWVSTYVKSDLREQNIQRNDFHSPLILLGWLGHLTQLCLCFTFSDENTWQRHVWRTSGKSCHMWLQKKRPQALMCLGFTSVCQIWLPYLASNPLLLALPCVWLPISMPTQSFFSRRVDKALHSVTQYLPPSCYLACTPVNFAHLVKSD